MNNLRSPVQVAPFRAGVPDLAFKLFLMNDSPLPIRRSLFGACGISGLPHLSKDADPDIPIPKEAKAEYAKLK